MDVSKWPPEKSMQLPDHMFGRRWFCSVLSNAPGAVTTFVMSEASLPEWCVLWALYCHTDYSDPGAGIRIDLRLGQRAPATLAEFEALDLFVPYISSYTIGTAFWLNHTQNLSWPNLRLLIHSKSRRIVARLTNRAAGTQRIRLNFLVSGLPQEIPEELIPSNLVFIERKLDAIWKRIKL